MAKLTNGQILERGEQLATKLQTLEKLKADNKEKKAKLRADEKVLEDDIRVLAMEIHTGHSDPEQTSIE